jgi:hypothetical protein
VPDDLAGFIDGRPGWVMRGTAAVMSADNGWTARVRVQSHYALNIDASLLAEKRPVPEPGQDLHHVVHSTYA